MYEASRQKPPAVCPIKRLEAQTEAEAYPVLEYDAMVLLGLRELKSFTVGMAAARELAKL